ncbi:MAG: ABC-2 transporter permease [Clostridia bacterium]|nr:ABC-2 transporter permease [Clostridia bacterium]
MKGLLLKDLKTLGAQAKILFLLLAFYLVFSVAQRDYSMLSVMVSVFGAILPITALAYDERGKWERYALTMPISRRDLVLSKYLLGLLLLGGGFLLSVVCQLLGGTGVLSAVVSALQSLSIGALMLSVTLLASFRFGVEKGRFVMMLAVFLPSVVVLSVGRLASAALWVERLLNLLPVIAAAALLLSALTAVRIYAKREF